MTLPERYHLLLDDVQKTALQCGRSPEEITVVVVSKTVSAQEVAVLAEEGAGHFGENRVEELHKKQEQLNFDLSWHFIGHLQSKKVAKIIGRTELVHSIDRLSLLEEVGKKSVQQGVTTRCLLQVNVSGEESKQGFALEQCAEAVEKGDAMAGIELCGLMTMAPFVQEESVLRSCFKKLRTLRDSLGKKQLPFLSMGMSNDYRYAIEEGATHIRVGSALFR